MMSITHAIVGLVLGEVLLLNTPLVILSAVLPDIDYLIGLEHRGVTHSLLFMITASLIAWKLKGKRAGFSVLIGLASHLIIDSLNPMGVKALWPLPLNFSFRVVNSMELTANLFTIALCGIIYLNKDSIINYLTGLRNGVALKGSLIVISLWTFALLLNPIINCAGTAYSINGLLNEGVSGEAIKVNGVICSNVTRYYSKSGNEYQVFKLCDSNDSIKVFKGEWILDNKLSNGDSVLVCGKYSTDYSEPEITYIESIIKFDY